MRTRNKSYSDYGITSRDKRYILDFCQNSNEEQKNIIRNALTELPPYVAPYVYYSLIGHLSYDDLCAKESKNGSYLFIGKGDFYGYRRKGMEAIKRWLILNGMWEVKM